MTENPSNPITAVSRSVDRAPDQFGVAGVAPGVDARLLDDVRGGDQQAMTEIFDRYGRMVYSVALRVLQDPGHAEDVMQEVLLKVWREPQTFLEGRGSLGAWLAVMARNRAIDALRRRRPAETVDDVVLVSKTNLASEFERNSMIEKVRGVLKGLPVEQQASMELAYFEGLSHTEIAATATLAAGLLPSGFGVSGQSIESGLQAVDWPGRWQRTDLGGRLAVLDVSHNSEGAGVLDTNLARLRTETGRAPVAILGVLGAVRAKPLLEVLCKHCRELYLVVPQQPRASSHAELESLVPGAFRGKTVRSTVGELFPGPGLCTAGASDDVIVVTGSIYLLGEVLARLEPQRGRGEGRLQDF